MNSTLPQTLLIVPCYNESARLNLSSFAQDTPTNVDLLFMDDGSSDNTYEILQKFCAEHPRHRVLRSEKNRGKAEIIRLGYLFLKSLSHSYVWVGFWDADLATPLPEVTYFLNYQVQFSPDAQAIFGSRIDRFGAKVRRRRLRHYFSRAFVTLTDILFGIRAYDSQCGAKLFKFDLCEQIFAENFVSKWIFDLEIILRVGAARIVEIPVLQWSDVPGSKVHLGRDIWRLLFDLKRIQQRYKR